MNEPFSILESAIGLHELYVSYVEAGFTEQQAFELVKSIVSNVGGSSQ